MLTRVIPELAKLRAEDLRTNASPRRPKRRPRRSAIADVVVLAAATAVAGIAVLVLALLPRAVAIGLGVVVAVAGLGAAAWCWGEDSRTSDASWIAGWRLDR